MTKQSVAILGATGVVGQKFIRLLENHPRFEITQLVASEKSTGQTYGEIVNWHEDSDLPKNIAAMKLKSIDEVNTKFALSSLPSETALIWEMDLAKKGIHVVSNACAYRMHKDVPLLIPEINGDHISLVDSQKTKGKIVTNPNCSTVFLVGGVYPLLSLGEIDHISAVTLQAISGAGYPGVSSLDILGDTIPYIKEEEEKIETETKKILGTSTTPANFFVTAHVNRIPVKHGHSAVTHVFFKNKVDIKQVIEKFSQLEKEFPQLYKIHNNPTHPRPSDLTSTDLRIHVGRFKQGDNDKTVGLVALGHNLVRGAAGVAILNLELLDKHLRG